jgi:hypothetical protein
MEAKMEDFARGRKDFKEISSFDKRYRPSLRQSQLARSSSWDKQSSIPTDWRY